MSRYTKEEYNKMRERYAKETSMKRIYVRKRLSNDVRFARKLAYATYLTSYVEQ